MQITISTGLIKDFTQHAKERLKEYTENFSSTIGAEAVSIAANRSLDSGRLEVTDQDVERGYRAYTAKAGAASRRAQVIKTIGTVLVGVVVSLVTAPLIADGLSALMRLGLAGLFAVALVCATVLSWRK